MEACDAFVTVDGNLEIGYFGDLLDRKIIPYGARAIPHEVMDSSERGCACDDLVEEIVDGFLAST